MTAREVLKMYSDYKSPYAWLAFDPAFALEQKFAVTLKWIPFQLRLKGSGQRSARRGSDTGGQTKLRHDCCTGGQA